MSERRVSVGQIILVGVAVFILLAPLGVVCLMSFNASPFGTFPFEFSMHWYERLFSRSSRGLWEATATSLQLAVVVTITTVILGTLASIWLVRFARRTGRFLVNGMLVAAVSIPWLVLGVAMLLVVSAVGIGRGWFALFLGNLVVALPYTVFLVASSLGALNPNIDEAARSLGSRPLGAFMRVVVPAILPAIAAGTIMAFLTCFNNFTIQFFLAPFGTQTLPMEIYGQIKVGFRPDINALAAILTALTLLPVFLAPRLLSRRGGRFSIGV